MSVLGDSLTAGYGLAPQDAFPAQLQRALEAANIAAKVSNAGVSGDTSAGGLARLDWVLGDQPQVVIVELGGNDMLRGLPPSMTRSNLDTLLTRLKGAGVVVLLAGMRAAPNLGPSYAAEFDRIFPSLAKKHGALLYPFFLKGVAGRPDLNLPDGIHPTAKGVGVIVEGILPTVKVAVERARSQARSKGVTSINRRR